MKCVICEKRKADNRHAKDYNHKNIRAKGNCARTCEWCHLSLHQLNQKNHLDWDYLMKNKKKQIIKRADRLFEKAHPSLGNKELGGRVDSQLNPPSPSIINIMEVKHGR